MEIGAAVTAIKAAIDAAKAAKDVHSQAQLDAAVSEIMDKLATAQTNLLSMIVQQHDLVEENQRLKEELAIQAQFERYRLSKTPVGHFIYKLKEEYVSEDEPMHAVCVKCREDGRRSILQEDEYGYTCPACKTVADLKRQSGFAISSGPTYNEQW